MSSSQKTNKDLLYEAFNKVFDNPNLYVQLTNVELPVVPHNSMQPLKAETVKVYPSSVEEFRSKILQDSAKLSNIIHQKDLPDEFSRGQLRRSFLKECNKVLSDLHTMDETLRAILQKSGKFITSFSFRAPENGEYLITNFVIKELDYFLEPNTGSKLLDQVIMWMLQEINFFKLTPQLFIPYNGFEKVEVIEK